jgi:hypothetical protein
MSDCFARSGSFAAIFSFDGSKKWIIRDGPNGTSRTGSGAPMARGFRKSRGLRIGRELAGRAGRGNPTPRVGAAQSAYSLTIADRAGGRRLHAEIAERALVEVVLDDRERAVAGLLEDVDRTDLGQLLRDRRVLRGGGRDLTRR